MSECLFSVPPKRIWLVDLAQSLPPTVQFYGLDISLIQAPVSKWLPSNIKLQKWDMFTEPPAELIDQFDIVHVRLIGLAINDNNVLPVVQNLRKLLRMNKTCTRPIKFFHTHLFSS